MSTFALRVWARVADLEQGSARDKPVSRSRSKGAAQKPNWLRQLLTALPLLVSKTLPARLFRLQTIFCPSEVVQGTLMRRRLVWTRLRPGTAICRM